MCGLAGIADFDGIDRGGLETRLKRVLDRLRPRGPDAQSTWFTETCAFAHTRLKIIDLSEAGAQPMTDGPLTLVYNGEIYNFRALRSELEGLGRSFNGNSDTEVLLAGWRQWGEDVLPRLAGMFAIAVWNAETSTLTLARDRFGKKPLYYRTAARRLSFASDLVALSRLDDTDGTIDIAALRLFFALRFVPESTSILNDVVKVPPGGLVRFGAAGADTVTWYRLTRQSALYGDRRAAAADLCEAVDTAVAERMIADVPLGAFLSGGIDSAIVVASMARQDEHVRTFTIGFEDAPAYYEERPAARRIADHLGTRHVEIGVTSAMTRELCEAVFNAYDEPFADSSALPTYVVAREARHHVTVALSGDGGDEVFAGYRKYLGEVQAARYQHLPNWLRRHVIEPLGAALPDSKSDGWRDRARQVRRFLSHAGKNGAARQAGWLRSLSEDELDAMIIPTAAGPTPESLIAEIRDGCDGGDPLNRMLCADIGFGLPADMLTKVDRASMANSLEVRCPLLDHRVVECAAAMPGDYKLSAGRTKRILREAFADRLPEEVFDRPKKGFEIPIAEWLTGGLADLCRWAIDPTRLARQELLRPEMPAQWLDDLAAGRRDTSWQLWTVIAFQAWWERQFGDGVS
ncbi:MAG: asparagine synthase (glutamine-hydrolyzing) [Alphaproteobacteria bacterium]|nr:asparagine synthase (glutamine-hydrolyzing) [Alphaproteobacteria bacterium]